MVRSKRVMLALFLALVPALVFAEGGQEKYAYPFANPYEATVIGTPPLLMAKLPAKIPVETRTLKVFPERKIPDVFWYEDGLVYSLARQEGKAPLIFIVAGTGASYKSTKMQELQKAFYEAGFHVVCISSPTYMNFIINGSGTMIPGDLINDAGDLYKVMTLVWGDIRKKVIVTDFYLTGYSLGAAESAFVAKLDEDEKVFDFKKVLLLNPPVSLYNSVSILDKLVYADLEGGKITFNDWFEKLMTDLAKRQKEFGPLDFSGDWLYQTYLDKRPSENALKTLIGVAFRLSSSSMIFTSDVMNGGGYIVPRPPLLTSTSSLTEYAKVGNRTTFEDYFHQYFFPFFKRQYPGLTEDELKRDESLESIEDYLKSSSKIGLMTNADDIILAPGEIDFLRDVFGGRARIYPTGGH
ncbi:MAG: alpha/beta hydrolase, partial [Desulfuromonadales bacterium]